MLDLTDRLIQPTTPVRAANGNVKWHVPRRLLQMACGALLVALPLTNGLRLDLRRDEFYFAWHKMAAHDLFLLFWVSMLGVALLSAVSFLYGRLWCGWVCPQTLASDFRRFAAPPAGPRLADTTRQAALLVVPRALDNRRSSGIAGNRRSSGLLLAGAGDGGCGHNRALA